METGQPPGSVTVAARWAPRGVSDEVAAFSRTVVVASGPSGSERVRSLLWSASRLGAFAQTTGLGLDPGVVFAEATIERFLAVATSRWSPATRRSIRANLRFLARRLDPAPTPLPLARQRARPGYSPAELAGFFARADAQPTVGRRARAVALLCLGAGAGLTGADLRAVTGADVVVRSGGLVVDVRGRRPRVVPVLAPFAPRLMAVAQERPETLLVGGLEPTRRNVTSPLIASLSGGDGLPRLELPRLRATWLATVAELIGLPTFMAAAGITCSQHLGDVVGTLSVSDEASAVALLGAAL